MVVCVCGTLIEDRGHSIGLRLVFEMGSVIGLGLSDPPVSISPSHQFTDAYRHAQLLPGCWVSRLRTSCFQGRHFDD